MQLVCFYLYFHLFLRKPKFYDYEKTIINYRFFNGICSRVTKQIKGCPLDTPFPIFYSINYLLSPYIRARNSLM